MPGIEGKVVAITGASSGIGAATGLVRLARDRYGKLDALVSNAGVGLISPLDDLRVEDREEMIDVNLQGVLYGIAAALPSSGNRASDTS
ncbi:SDR family NAD(P)-dependent oxidoreductase [Actinopolymorpha sp. NPDC004070]|uniref:SDR family oxidoreductase n=1 Tax=Actinopolymorpha sp. NPDC004070 TaxID=3154548 RepID=UPI0033B37A3A